METPNHNIETPSSDGAGSGKRKRARVPAGGPFSPDPKRPHTWGNNVWIIEGVESPEPPDRASDPDRYFIAAIRLAPLGEPVSLPDSLSVETILDGDSNYIIGGCTEPRKFTIVAGTIPIGVNVTLVSNQYHRLAGLLVEIPAAKSPRTAYQAARTVFNGLQMQVAFEHDLGIRESAIAVWDVNNKDVFLMRAAISHPELALDLSRSMPSPIMQRLLAPYADALNSNSPYYSFMVFFALLEFMLNSWIGAVRRAYEARGLTAPKRSYVVLFEQIYELAPWYYGKSYQDVLTSMRHLRNAAGAAHFDFAIGPRALTVRADDEIACGRDVLRIILKGMLEDARTDVQSLLESGIDESVLATELQAFFDKHSGHKKAKVHRAGR